MTRNASPGGDTVTTRLDSGGPLSSPNKGLPRVHSMHSGHSASTHAERFP